jgi:hypothetical protein
MSFFEDLVGGLAKSGAQGLNDISVRNQREDELKMQNDLAIERQKAAEGIRLDLEEKQRQAKQQRLSDQRQQVEAAAPAATQAREISQAQRLAPSVDSNVMDTIKARLSPGQVQKYYGVDTSAVGPLDDKLGIARSKGLYDAEAQLQAERKDTVSAIAAARKDALDQQRANAQDDRNIVAEQRNANTLAGVLATVQGRKDVAETRANAPGKGGGDNVTKLMDQTRKRMDSLLKQGDDDTPEYRNLQEYWTSLLDDQKAGRAARRGDASPAATTQAPAGKPAAAVKEFTYDPKTRTFK